MAEPVAPTTTDDGGTFKRISNAANTNWTLNVPGLIERLLHAAQAFSVVPAAAHQDHGRACGLSGQDGRFLGRRPFPDDADHYWDRRQDSHSEERPSCSFALIFVELIGHQ
jgi:hypothetical protein